VRYETRVPILDPAYEQPTPEEIRIVMRQAGLTGSATGEVLGVNGWTVRKWTGGE